MNEHRKYRNKPTVLARDRTGWMNIFTKEPILGPLIENVLKGKDNFIILSKNTSMIRCLFSSERELFEHTIKYMIKQKIQAYLIQDYLLEGNGQLEIKGHTIFYHSCSTREEKRGVAIILSPIFTKAWTSAGSPEPTTTPEGEFEGRFISISLHFPHRDINKEGITMLLVSTCNQETNNSGVVDVGILGNGTRNRRRLNKLLSNLLKKSPKHDDVIIGADILGLRDRKETGHGITRTHQSNLQCYTETFLMQQHYAKLTQKANGCETSIHKAIIIGQARCKMDVFVIPKKRTRRIVRITVRLLNPAKEEHKNILRTRFHELFSQSNVPYMISRRSHGIRFQPLSPHITLDNHEWELSKHPYECELTKYLLNDLIYLS